MKLSLLDQLHIAPGGDSISTIQHAMEMARLLDGLGYERHWIVEHHAVPYELCADPMLVALAIAQVTRNLRVGVGGVLLNNYSPYKIAESLKTLSLLVPNRVDVGLGHSFSGVLPDLALQVDRSHKPAHDQEHKIQELLGYLRCDLPKEHQFKSLEMLPDVPSPLPWIMAVSTSSAERAGRLGLPLALSAFHRPEEAVLTAQTYRKHFRPSGHSGMPTMPKCLLAIRLFTAETQKQAERLSMPMRWAFDQRRRLSNMPLSLPNIEQAIKLMGGVLSAPQEEWPMYVICALKDVRTKLFSMANAVGADEIMVQDGITDTALRFGHYTNLANEIAKG